MTLTSIAMCLVVLLPASHAAPSSHITEEIVAGYYCNGSLRGVPSATGYVEVDVQDQTDVLQSVSLELSSTSGTNLGSSAARKNVAASPYPGDKTRMFLNTSGDPQDISYAITDYGSVPLIELKLDYVNSMGGSDLHSGGTNTFSFNLSLNSTADASGVVMNLRFARDTLGSSDSFELRDAHSDQGSAQVMDSDWDGTYDMVRWQGSLSAGVPVLVSFQGETIPGANFDEGLMMVDLDSGVQSTAASSMDHTLTGITFTDRSSRGPVRQGIEMVHQNVWLVRGFMKNVAYSLDYIVHGWDIYRIGSGVPLISSSQEEYLDPGDHIYTDWYDTGQSSKQDYYSSAFDWEVVWGTSQYSGLTESRIYLPVLYEMDSFTDKTVLLGSNSQSGRTVSVTDTIRHLGHLSLGVNGVGIISRLPGSSLTGAGTSWNPSNVRIVYSNATGQYDITSQANITTQGATPGSDGFVMVNITGLSSVLGHGMEQNDDIILSYDVSGPACQTTQQYSFSVQGTLITESGTPDTAEANQTLQISGVYVPSAPGAPGGPAYVAPQPFASIEKESSDFRFITSEYVEINVTGTVVDTGEKGIKDVKSMVYIPLGGSLDTDEVTLRIYRSSTGRWEEWERDVDFILESRRTTTIGETGYREYLIEKKGTGVPYEETLDLYDGDRIGIGFRAKIPVGTSYILTRIFGYNYYEDKLIFEDVYTPLRREGVVSRLEIMEEEWVQESILVGSPVIWRKEIVVYNPNNFTVEELVSTEIFKDVISAYLVGYGDGTPERTRLKLKSGDGDAYTEWIAEMDGFETRIYAIEITTPPVLETKEILDVLESNETMVRFFLNITMVNFALEDYRNVSLKLSISPDKITSVRDEKGDMVWFTDTGEGIEINLEQFPSQSTRMIYITYEEKPPVMVTTLESLKYRCPDSVTGRVFIVPGESGKGAYLEMEIMGPEPSLRTVHADIVSLGELTEFQEERVPISFSASSLGSGRYVIYTKFKKDFGTILYHQRDFVIDCPEREIISISWLVFLAIAIAIIAFLVFRIYRKKTYRREIRELKKRIKGI